MHKKTISRYIMGVFYILAGANHFLHPAFYLRIMPPWLPYHLQLVYLSGICEVFCALVLLYDRTKKIGAWLVILLLIAIFPANIQMATDFVRQGNPYIWVAILRLPVQLLLIWWAWLYTRD